MSDYDLLREYAPGHAPEKQSEAEGAAHDHATIAKAVQHNRPEALGAAGAASLQRLAGNAATSALVAQREDDPNAGGDTSLVHKVVGSGGGSALDDGTRKSMESSLGADFSSVRVHTGSEAAAAAKSVQAQAFTVGNNIVLGAGKSTSDTRTMAHELTHVVQQSKGPVPGTSIGGGIALSDPSDHAEREAEATADHVMAGGAVDHGGHDHSAGSVQREAAEEEVQTLPIQREAESGESEEEEPVQMESVQREAESGESEEEEPVQMESVQRAEAGPEEREDESEE